MTPRNQIILLIFFAIYLSIVLLTDISLVGFWTDIIFSILLALFSLRIVFKNKSNRTRLTITLKTITVILSIIVFGLITFSFTNIFIWDTFKMRSFYYQKVDGRIFHAYFKPVGSYSGGQGNFWITESPIYFPIIEKRVYYDRTVHWDFNSDTFDGEPVDNYQVVKRYIEDKVINKK
jgi:energy-coupling factor transporter transmembrane protein EcfT